MIQGKNIHWMNQFWNFSFFCIHTTKNRKPHNSEKHPVCVCGCVCAGRRGSYWPPGVSSHPVPTASFAGSCVKGTFRPLFKKSGKQFFPFFHSLSLDVSCCFCCCFICFCYLMSHDLRHRDTRRTKADPLGAWPWSFPPGPGPVQEPRLQLSPGRDAVTGR